ncbi:MAG: nucleoside triphosphate pyrophosphohydrolase [Candidatus Acidiferrales bacterium]
MSPRPDRRARSRKNRPRKSRSKGRGKARVGQHQPRRARARRPGALFEQLVSLQATLRAPRGCPWDREQTHQSLRTYLLEEAYEVLEALEAGDDAQLAAELGDLLLQVVFHAQLAREAGRFDIRDVIEQIQDKLIRRHPHVFGNIRAKTSAQVLKNWEQLKAEERQAKRGMTVAKAPRSLLDGVPRTLPALLEAHQLTRRASRIGFDWENFEGLLEKLREEATELREAHGRVGQPQVEEEVGDLLFVAVNVARFLGMDPEVALKKANRKFAARFREMEQQAARSGRRLTDLSRDDLEALWDASKAKRQSAPAGGRAPASGGRAPASSGRR